MKILCQSNEDGDTDENEENAKNDEDNHPGRPEHHDIGNEQKSRQLTLVSRLQNGKPLSRICFEHSLGACKAQS